MLEDTKRKWLLHGGYADIGRNLTEHIADPAVRKREARRIAMMHIMRVSRRCRTPRPSDHGEKMKYPDSPQLCACEGQAI